MSASSLPTPASRDPNAWPRRFVVLGLLTAIMGSSAPIPLYPIFRQSLHLDASTMTLIFVVYVVGALTALLTMGQWLSRLANPYRLLGPSLLLVAVGASLMASANGLETLLAGRLLAGLATGGVTVAANVALIELSPMGNPRHGAMLSSLSFGTGSALGPIVTGILLQLGWWPMVLPFVFIASGALLASQTAFRRWSSHRHNAPSATSGEPGTLADAPIPWAGFLLCAACIISAWGVGSTTMALGPFFGDALFGYSNYAVSGFLVAGYLIATTTSQWLHRRGSLRPTFLRGCLMAVGGLAVLAVAVQWQALWLAIPALLLAAAGNGAAFGAAAGLIHQISPPRHRARLVSWFYTAGYLSNLLPLLIGMLIDRAGSVLALNLYLALTGALLLMVGLAVRRMLPRP